MNSSILLSRLKYVVLDCPYDTWEQQVTRELFWEITGLKIKGYSEEYPYGVLALNAEDFVGTHFMVCLQEDDQLIPISGYKSIDLYRCQIHCIEPSILYLLSSSAAHNHLNEMRAIIQNALLRKKKFRWECSYTISPEYRGEHSLLMRQLLTAMHVNYHLENKTDISVVSGVVRFKMDLLFKSWGYNELTKDEIPLGPVSQKSLSGEPIKVFTLGEFSQEAKEIAKMFSKKWEERIIITSKEQTKKEAA